VRTLRLTIFAVVFLSTCCFAAQTNGYIVAGLVVNSVSGQRLAGVSITLAPDRSGDPSQTVQSSDEGRFHFAPVAAGKYMLSASGPGYRAQGLNQHEYFFSAVVTGPDQDTSNIVFRLQPDASIRGQVIDEQSEPVRNATAQLFTVDESSGTRRIVQATNAGTDDRGFYHFAHLAPGTYYVAVSARPWYAQYAPLRSRGTQPRTDAETSARAQQESSQLDMAYPLTFYPDATDSSQANVIDLHAGERTGADIVIRAVPAVHLSVHTDWQQQHGASPRIMQRVFDNLLVPVLAIQGYGYVQGVYEFAGLAPGHYVIEAPSADAGGRNGWYREVELYGNMELGASDSPPMASVTGMVVYEGSPPPRGSVYIELSNVQNGDGWSGQVSDKGLFGLKDNDVRPGTYDLHLYGGPDWFITRLVAQNAKVQETQITVPPGASARLVCTATRISSNVTGTVLVNDKPLAGAMVLLVPDDTTRQVSRVRRDQSDSDGSFTLRQVLPGNYTVLALRDGWELEWGNLQNLKPYLPHGEKIAVAAGQNANIKLVAQ
jgi:hypothetical protein